jgi:hypothetical protein
MAAASADEPVYYRVDQTTQDCCVFTHSFREIIPKDKIREYMDCLFKKLKEFHLSGIKKTEFRRFPRVTLSEDGMQIMATDEHKSLTTYTAVPLRMITESDF